MSAWTRSLVVLGLGIATAVLTVSGLVAPSLVAYRALTNACFFGLIAASGAAAVLALDRSTDDLDYDV